jgi:hypothetical protein
MYKKLTAIFLYSVALLWGGSAIAQEEEEQSGISERTRNCVNTRRIRRTHIVDDRNLLFYLGTRTVLLNTMQEQCAGLKREGQFSWSTNSGVLCRGDGISSMRNAGGRTRPVPRCALGIFYQISREDADAMRMPVAVAPATGPMPITDSLPMPAPDNVGTDPEDTTGEPEK